VDAIVTTRTVVHIPTGIILRTTTVTHPIGMHRTTIDITIITTATIVDTRITTGMGTVDGGVITITSISRIAQTSLVEGRTMPTIAEQVRNLRKTTGRAQRRSLSQKIKGKG
jgi:hypothetical protein